MLVSEIYLKVGYQSDKYFIKVFKGLEGSRRWPTGRNGRQNEQQ